MAQTDSSIRKPNNVPWFKQVTENYGNFKSEYDTVFQIQQAAQLDNIEEINESLDELQAKINEHEGSEAVDKALKKVEEKKEKLARKAENEDDPAEDEDHTEDLKEIEEKQKAIDKINNQIDGLDKALEDGATVFEKLNEELSGHVSVEDMSEAAKTVNQGYDNLLSDGVKIIDGDGSTKFIEAWARTQFGDKLYEATSAIKNGTADAISGIDSLMKVGDTFGGDWSDPKQDALKIQKGIKQIQDGISKVATTANNVAKALGIDNKLLKGAAGLSDNIVINSTSGVAGASAIGIGAFEAFRSGNITRGISAVGQTIGSLKNTVISVQKHSLDVKKQILQTGGSGQQTGFAANMTDTVLGDSRNNQLNDTTVTSLNNSLEGNNIQHSGNTDAQTLSDKSGSDTNGSNGNSSTKSSVAVDDFSADLIHEISVALDGVAISGISTCDINGEKYRLSGYNISQELLEPMSLTFTLDKEDKTETNKDVLFRDATQLIGKSIEVKATSRKTSMDSGATPGAFHFKGIITDIDASRAVASAQSASVVAKSYDCLLQNAPHCRSFENKSLKEIVEAVLLPFKDIEKNVNPRFTSKIPYTVQYNQDDLAFLKMLAIRYGEWMYNTGTSFIFGEFGQTESSSASLQYPGGSLMSYSLNQMMSSFAFSHLLNNHYSFGSADGISKKGGKSQADSNLNEWTEKAYAASNQRFSQEQITALNVGGFDNQQDDEGADAITEYAVKVQAHGRKTGLMTVRGFSKLAMLNIGQTFEICDNAQNISGQNTDIKQTALRITGIQHSFDYSQDYSNSFTAVPNACNYPDYTDPDVFPIARSQRAKVTDNKDGQKLGRIRVQFPWQSIQNENMQSPWLRIVVPYAGNMKGHQFIPEIGEEVMVGFEMDNAERPYVIGALYNGGTGKTDEKWAASESEDDTTNNIKAIRTRNGHTILFNDKGDAGSLTIYDNKNKAYQIILSADDKKITIYSAGDIEINADGSISMTARENVSIKADSNVSVKADKEVSIQASKVKVR